MALAAFYLALTFWMTRPLLWHAASFVPGPSGDNLYFTWLIDWYRDALSARRMPVSVPTLNAPEGWSLAYNEMTPTTALLGMPAFLFGGPALAYNVAFWLSFLLSGLFAALWLWRITGRLTPGIVAGIVFAFAPYRLSHAYGHINLLGTEWLPLYFLCLIETLRGGRAWWAAGAAISFVALAGASQYYLYMTALLSVPIAIVLLRKQPGWYRDFHTFRNGAIGVGLAVPFVALLIWPYLTLARQGLIAPHDIADVRGWSASPTDFFLPSRLHWLVGDWITDRFKAEVWVERTLNLGLTPFALAIVGWWSARHDKPLSAQVARMSAVAGTVAFVLALGTHLHWLEREVQIPVPWLARVWLDTSIEQVSMPLPGYLLFRYLPFYASMRVWMRWGIYVSLFVSVLAGLGVDRLTRARSFKVSAAVTAGLCALVLMEFSQKAYPLTAVEPRPVDTWLAEWTDRGTVIQMPSDELASPQETFHTMYHGHPFVGAFFSAFPSRQYSRIDPALRNFPDQSSVETMRTLGVRWVLVDLSRYDNAADVQAQAAASGLSPVGQVGDQFVFTLQ